MKHQHEISDANIHVEIPKQDLEQLIDKIERSAITIVVTLTIAQIVKFHLTR